LSGWSALKANNQIEKIPFIKILNTYGDTLKSIGFEDLYAGTTRMTKVFKDKIAIYGVQGTKLDLGVQLNILDKNLNINWQYRVEVDASVVGFEAVGDDHYIYLMIGHIDIRENIPEEDRAPYFISIYKINKEGKLVLSKKLFPKGDIGTDRNIKLLTTIDDGKVVLIVNSYENVLKDKSTNSRDKCRRMITTWISINSETLLPSKEMYFKNYTINSIKKAPDDLFYLIGSHESECGSSWNLSIIRGDSERGFNPFFTFESPLSQYGYDIVFYKNKILVTGMTDFRFYPTPDFAGASRSIKSSRLDSKWIEESIILSGVKSLGWILLVNSNGKLLMDKIIFDNRLSSVVGLDINSKGEGIATGVINGYQLLEMGFSLN